MRFAGSASKMASGCAKRASTMSSAQMPTPRCTSLPSGIFGAAPKMSSAKFASSFETGSSSNASFSSANFSSFTSTSPSSATFTHSAASIALSNRAAGVPAALANGFLSQWSLSSLCFSLDNSDGS
ncbi:hypothetical protein HDU67_009498 [Dinochytrium kinnereticum]|nr:hypothetical protein HDU67_009498 [Dinochytrium kinnereticum]